MTNLQIESECRQKLQKLDSEYQQKLIPYTISGHESLSGLPDPISETLTAESRAKVDAILTEYHRKWAAIVAEREARLADERNRTAPRKARDSATTPASTAKARLPLGKIGRPT